VEAIGFYAELRRREIMILKKENVLKALEEVYKDKGKRKFKQTIEMAINFRGIDFSKPENRLNLEIPLPKGKGKESGVVVFADGDIAVNAKKIGAQVFSGDEIPKITKQQIRKHFSSVLIAQPNLMAVVGKSLGKFLAPRNKLPFPLRGDLKAMVDMAKRTVVVKSKGKYLPVAHVPVGSEDMLPEDIFENIEAIYEKVVNKTGEHNIKSIFLKSTMGKAQKVEMK